MLSLYKGAYSFISSQLWIVIMVDTKVKKNCDKIMKGYIQVMRAKHYAKERALSIHYSQEKLL